SLAGFESRVSDASEQTCRSVRIVGRYSKSYRKSLNSEVDGLSTAKINEERLRSAEAALKESIEFNQAVIDSLPQHIVILDPQGIIVAVNRAWREFARESESEEFNRNIGAGSDYSAVCRASAGEHAEAVYIGIKAVLNGASDLFTIEY